MLSRAVTRLATNKLSIIPKRGYNGVLYQFSPPKNKLSTGELVAFGVLLVSGVMGPAIYFASQMHEYNGKAAARRAAAGNN